MKIAHSWKFYKLGTKLFYLIVIIFIFNSCTKTDNRTICEDMPIMDLTLTDSEKTILPFEASDSILFQDSLNNQKRFNPSISNIPFVECNKHTESYSLIYISPDYPYILKLRLATYYNESFINNKYLTYKLSWGICDRTHSFCGELDMLGTPTNILDSITLLGRTFTGISMYSSNSNSLSLIYYSDSLGIIAFRSMENFDYNYKL